MRPPFACSALAEGLSAAGRAEPAAAARVCTAAVPDFLRRLATDGRGDRLGFIHAEFWQRLTARLPLEELRLVADAAGLPVWSKAQLTAEVLARALARPAAEVDRALHRLAEYLTETRYEEGGAEETFFRVYHESFADFLRATLAADRERLCGALADFCAGWDDLSDGYARTYALRFGPLHLTELGRRDALESLLTDWRFLEAKAGAGYVFDLAVDLEAAGVPARPRPADSSGAGGAGDRHRVRVRAPVGAVPDRVERGVVGRRGAGGVAGGLAEWLEGEYPNCVAFSPDGKRVAVGTAEAAVRVWNLETGQATATHLGTPVGAVCYSAGTRFAAGFHDGRIDVWETETGAHVYSADLSDDLETMRKNGFEDETSSRAWVPNGVLDLARGDGMVYAAHGHGPSKHLITRMHDRTDGGRGWLSWTSGGISAAAFTPHGERLALGCGSDGGGVLGMFLWQATVRVESLRTEEVFELRWRGERPDCIRFSPDGGRVAAGGPDRTVRAWELAGRRELWCSDDLAAGVACVAVAADGRVAAGMDRAGGAVVVLDAESGAVRARLPGHPGGVHGLAFPADGAFLASVGANKVLRVWDLSACGSGPAVHGWPVSTTAVSPDGSRAAAGFDDGTVRVCEVATGRSRMSAASHLGRVTALAFTEDGLFLATGSEDGTACVWDTQSGERLARSGEPEYRRSSGLKRLDALAGFAPDRGPRAVYQVQFTPDGGAVEFSDGRTQLWKWRAGEAPAEVAAGGAKRPKVRGKRPRDARAGMGRRRGHGGAGGERGGRCGVPAGRPPRSAAGRRPRVGRARRQPAGRLRAEGGEREKRRVTRPSA